MPSGLFFTLLGLILPGMAIFDPAARSRLARGVQVNLICAAVILAFGAWLLLLAARAQRHS